MRLLVIEDNERLAELVRKSLEEQGFVAVTTPSGREGEEKAASETFDGIILDLILPDLDGMQVCRELRQRRVSTPILMLSALSSTTDKVCGLEAGADDYLSKPFEFEELIARVRAMLRRSQSSESAKVAFGDVEMDLVLRKVTRAGRVVALTTKEFSLLEFFLRNPERVLTRTLIAERVWDLPAPDESNVIDVYVYRLRNKIDKGFDQPLIHTVVGSGYVMSAERRVRASA